MSDSPTPHLRAILYALGGYISWSLSDAFLKLASETGVSKPEIMFLGGISGLATIGVVAALQGRLGNLRPRAYGGLFALGVFYALCLLAILYAVQRLPLANYYVIIFMAPMLIAAAASVFMGEHLSWRQGLAILAGFGGVIVAVNPAHLADRHDRLIGYGIAFGALLLFVVQMLLLRVVGRRETRETMAFYTRLLSVLGALGACLFWHFEMLSPYTLIVSVVSGILGSSGWLFMAHSYKLAPAATVAPFHYVQIISGTLLGYLIWHDVPSWNVAAGAVVIIASGLYLAFHARRQEMAAAPLEVEAGKDR